MSNMIIKGLIDEDFVNYKVPSMTIMFPNCNFKCEVYGAKCQNSDLAKAQSLEVSIDKLCERYLSNNITRAVVCQGLEPFDSFRQLTQFIEVFRNNYECEDDIVIYTGYTEQEIQAQVNYLSRYKNIIVKFGRYVPHQKSHFDPVLGVKLVSDNQYARCLS